MFEGLRSLSTSTGAAVNAQYLAEESGVVRELARRADSPAARREAVHATAAALVGVMRRERAEKSGLDAFLSQYDLSSAEGVALMCLAEALLRIPDPDTADALIADRLAAGDWERHLGESDSLFVNASTWGLMLTGKMVRPDPAALDEPADFLRALVGRLGEPVVRRAMIQAMRIMGEQFVMGRDIRAALRRAARSGNARYRHSFDMLGEAALTAADAQRYFEAYANAIEAVGQASLAADAGVSIKLSALSPRFEFLQAERAIAEIIPRVTELALTARQRDVALTIDAEEATRLEMTLRVLDAVCRDTRLAGFDGIGIAVQAYQRRAPAVIDWLAELAASASRRIPVRLVKGAYWDTEIKFAQESGLPDYPVFTRKVSTDVSYLACATQLFASRDRLVPAFATHNAHTVAWILHTAPERADLEFQRLHGMGEALYDRLLDEYGGEIACRVYAPVGRHEDLLPYLVRRLLENGANTSFVNRIVHEEEPVDALVGDPVASLGALDSIPNPRIPLPPALFGRSRRNSAGLNLADGAVLAELAAGMETALRGSRSARPVIDGASVGGDPQPSVNPADPSQVLGTVEYASAAQAQQALAAAARYFPRWAATPVAERTARLRDAADLFEAHRAELMALCVAEAGKTVTTALGEVREAVDFLRYYAAEAERLMAAPTRLPGPTGERNELRLGGRGPFVCISPWNFPLAIFTGQVAAALAAGNTVVAKPAEQTGLIASRAVALLHEAGVPAGALHFVPGDGAVVGQALAGGAGTSGIAFTGSVATARSINRALAAREGPIAVLIAETGGQNAMIVDSTALPEQVVRDVVSSAFDSAGQRCSALRILCLQEEIADRVITMLAGHMAELKVGDPARPDTDVGPVIDGEARAALLAHRESLLAAGRLVHECELPVAPAGASFFAPLAVEISDISMLKEEHFGPILHILRYPSGALDTLLAAIEATGFGLTFGFQSRIERRAAAIAARAPAGNVYVNRNMIGAVVGAQPFGGRGLSGSGPKAGGPHYLPRFMTEKTVTVNTAAIGGNASLLAGQGD